MLFNSYSFILLFLPIVVLGYYWLRQLFGNRVSAAWLTLGSLFFYGYWNPKYLLLICASILMNYLLGRALQRLGSQARAGLLLVLGLSANLLLLAYYKYTDFFIANVNALFDTDFHLQQIILPLAISFFTFQQMAYLVDAYRGGGLHGGLLDYTLFVAFFPQLIAGPIVHHREMMPQFALKRNRLDANLFAQGLFLFSLGLFKKVMIADSLAPLVGEAFDGGFQLGLLDAWVGALAYAFQLYFDFSGYTDMAWGAALLVGIRLPQNFNSPYRATSIADFWRRWHITLGRFLRDYIYIPLGGNKMGQGRTLLNLFVTFLLGGLWHGAAWTFVAWGALHGTALAMERLAKNIKLTLPKPLAIVFVFLFVTLAWVFFRAADFQSAQRVLAGMLGLNGWQWGFQSLHPANRTLAWLGLAAASVWLLPNSNQMAEKVKMDLKWLLATIGLFLVAFWHIGKFSEFIYFQF